jgi:hypothetical protein
MYTEPCPSDLGTRWRTTSPPRWIKPRLAFEPSTTPWLLTTSEWPGHDVDFITFNFIAQLNWLF